MVLWFRTIHLHHLSLVNSTYHRLCRLVVSEEFAVFVPPRLQKVPLGLRFLLGHSFVQEVGFLEGFNFLLVLPVLLNQLFDFFSKYFVSQLEPLLLGDLFLQGFKAVMYGACLTFRDRKFASMAWYAIFKLQAIHVIMQLPSALGEGEAAGHRANDWDLRAFSHKVKLQLNILEWLRYFLAGCPEWAATKDCCV